MMTCSDWKAFLHDYVLGDLSDPARELMGHHAGTCPSCLGEARALQVVDRGLRDEPWREPLKGLADRALRPAAAPSIRRELARLAAALALACGLAAGAGLVGDRIPEDIRSSPRVFLDAASLIADPTFFPIPEAP
jgi:anti-sigma factor RsiW